MEIEKWMIVQCEKNYILLHHNEDLEQYKDMPRLPHWFVWIIQLINSLKIGAKK